jgi:Tfp pilus assembly protein PilN
MLRTNLSTRPFYNERAVRAGLLAAAAIVLVLTAVNLFRIVSLSRQNTDLSTQIVQEQQEATRLTDEAAAIRRTIDPAELERIVLAAGEANALIDQRTFSWTEFFNWLEVTLPADVMLTSVRPIFQEGNVQISMNLLGRRAEDIDEFFERLEDSGAFARALPTREDRSEQGLYRVAMTVLYLPHDSAAAQEPDAAEAPASPPAPAGEAPPAPGGRGGQS